MPKRSRQSSAASGSTKKTKGVVVVDAQNETEIYYKVEEIMDFRYTKRRGYEYRIRWEGCSEADDTWEPEDCLCDTVLEEALEFRKLRHPQSKKYTKQHQERKPDDSDDDRKMPAREDGPEEEEEEDDDDETSLLNDGGPDWSDKGQISFRDIERISVNDPMAAQRVMDARVNGVPVCLVDHKGWAQFAKPWLEPIEEDFPPCASAEGASQDAMRASQQPGVSGTAMQGRATLASGQCSPRSVALAAGKDRGHSANSIPVSRLPIVNRMEPSHPAPPAYIEFQRRREAGISTVSSSTPQLVKENRVDPTLKAPPVDTRVLPQQEDGCTESLFGSLPAKENLIEPVCTVPPTSDGVIHQEKEAARCDQPKMVAFKPAHRPVNSPRVATALAEHRPEVDQTRAQKDEGSSSTRSSRDYLFSHEHPESVPTPQEDLLDLSKPHRLCLESLVKDVGSEKVPIRRRRDDLRDPNRKKILLETFVNDCWEPTTACQNKSEFYLHQWQFPMSATAAKKLCGHGANVPIPNGIIGDDLLRYWYSEARYLSDNPYQYIFMGREGTMSKLHRDNGGLAITIAPIVGEKEVLLVHRADGPTSLYHLAANLDEPDLNKFPLLYTARVWKTIVRPGEILIMPQGTYHQCRNVTPCLSYHRFILDDCNLKPFLESHFDGDATEIHHDDIIWNASYELNDMVDRYVDKVREEWLQTAQVTAWADIPQAVSSAILTLRKLRNVGKEIEIRQRRTDDPDHVEWHKMVEDIDVTLHGFKHRFYRKQPKRPGKKRKDRPKLSRDPPASGPTLEEEIAKEEVTPAYKLEMQFSRAPKLKSAEACSVISDSVTLQLDDRVVAKVHGKRLVGTISEIREHMVAAFIGYEDFDAECHSEFMPLENLRVKVAGDSIFGIAPNTELAAGKVVYCIENGEPYRAKVKTCRRGTFYLVSLELDNGRRLVQRWLARESFLSKIED